MNYEYSTDRPRHVLRLHQEKRNGSTVLTPLPQKDTAYLTALAFLISPTEPRLGK